MQNTWELIHFAGGLTVLLLTMGEARDKVNWFYPLNTGLGGTPEGTLILPEIGNTTMWTYLKWYDKGEQ